MSRFCCRFIIVSSGHEPLLHALNENDGKMIICKISTDFRLEHTPPAHQILKKVIVGLPPRLKGYVS
jgi:hypothetical protein